MAKKQVKTAISAEEQKRLVEELGKLEATRISIGTVVLVQGFVEDKYGRFCGITEDGAKVRVNFGDSSSRSVRVETKRELTGEERITDGRAMKWVVVESVGLSNITVKNGTITGIKIPVIVTSKE